MFSSPEALENPKTGFLWGNIPRPPGGAMLHWCWGQMQDMQRDPRATGGSPRGWKVGWLQSWLVFGDAHPTIASRNAYYRYPSPINMEI